MRVILEPYEGAHKRDGLEIVKGSKYVYFHAYIDGTGNSFVIKKEDLKKFV